MPVGKAGLRTRTTADADWVLEFSNFREAWDPSAVPPPRPGSRPRGEGIVVAHPDTGYTDHPELHQDTRYLVTSGRNYLERAGLLTASPSLDARDLLTGPHPSHGTSTASVLMSAEGPPDRIAVYGVAPMVRVIPYRVTDFVILYGDRIANLALAIYRALATAKPNELGVVSISLGTHASGWLGYAGLLSKVLAVARAKGVVVCAAPGQGPKEEDDPPPVPMAFPASDPNTIACAGCRADLSPLRSGILGPQIDITAPAVDVWIARTQKQAPAHIVTQSFGTSYATAVVAGACAMWQAHHGREWLRDPANYGPELIFSLFREVLARSSYKPEGWDSGRRGSGVLDAEKLLLEPLPSKSEIQAIDAADIQAIDAKG